MSRLMATILVLSLAGSSAALAQSGTGSGSSAQSGGIPQAPVGHRQPTKAAVDSAEAKDKRGLLGADADDKALDRKIKNICRGC